MIGLALRHDETLGDGVRRIAHALLAEACWLLDHADEVGLIHSVHHTRKRCKELRGVLRLVRPGIGDEAYRTANDMTRDAARLLADLRDRHAMLETFDTLIGVVADRVVAPGVGEVRDELRQRSIDASRPSADHRARLQGASTMLAAVGSSVDEWSFEGTPDEIIDAGIARTYRRSRREMHEAAATGDPHDFHRWRKRVKYGWYHAEILHRAAPSVLGPIGGARHRLSDALGDAHDLTVMVETAATSPVEFGGEAQVRALERLVEPVRVRLERAALLVGRRLYAEEADDHAARVSAQVEVWRTHGDEPDIGEIGELWPADDDLDDVPVGDLRRRATELGVGGRWSMGRRELVRSLQARGETAPPGRRRSALGAALDDLPHV